MFSRWLILVLCYPKTLTLEAGTLFLPEPSPQKFNTLRVTSLVDTTNRNGIRFYKCIVYKV